MATIRESIEAAAAELRGRDDTEESIEATETEVSSDVSDSGGEEIASSDEPSDHDNAERVRDERGRFAARDAARLLQSNGADANTGTNGANQAVSPEGQAGTQNPIGSVGAEVSDDEVKIQATHTYQDLKEDWQKLPRSLQERLVLRDRQRDTATEKALHEARKAREGWEPIETVFNDEDKQFLASIRSTPALATQRLWAAHKNLDANPDAGILFLADQYPVNRQGLAVALLGGEQGVMQLLQHVSQTGQIPYGNQHAQPSQPDPYVAQLEQKLREQEERVNRFSSVAEQFEQQAQQQRLGSLSAEFEAMMQEALPDGSPARPWMAEIVDDVLEETKLVVERRKAANQPITSVSDIRSATDEGYRRAVMMNPITRARMLEAERQRGAAKVSIVQKQKTQSARVAGKQVSGAPGNPSDALPEKRIDLIRHLAAQQQARR